MARNPDPKPGRWILPLVVAGMVGFTFFFLQQLPASEPIDDDDPGTAASSSTTTTTTVLLTTTTTTPLDPAIVAYTDAITATQTELAEIDAELQSIHNSFNERSIDFNTAVDRVDALRSRVATWVEGVAAIVTPTPDLDTTKTVMAESASAIATVLDDYRAGLVSSDTGQARAAAYDAWGATLPAYEDAANAAKAAATN